MVKYILRSVYFIFFTLFFVHFSFAGETDKGKNDLIEKKTNFILKVAAQIRFEKDNGHSMYKIGVYGRGKESKAIYEQLIKNAESTQIQGKKIMIYLFKRTRNVEQVDLIYLSADSKIRIRDLNERLEENPYNIITENYPFGTSSLNFMIDENDELVYEIQEENLRSKGLVIDQEILTNTHRITSEKKWKGKFGDAMKTIEGNQKIIQTQKSEIAQNNDLIQENKKEIKEHTELIKVQTEALGENAKIISSQRNLLIVGSISFLLIVGLLFMLLKANRARKAMIVEINSKNKSIIDSIHYAEHIQNAMLPPPYLINENLGDHFIVHKPKDLVSGDFYWLETHGEKIFFCVADCTGHGVPGAMMSVLCSNALTKTTTELRILEPGKILDNAVKILENAFSKSKEVVYDGMDLALCCIDTKKKTITYAGANNSLIYFKDKILYEVKSDKQPIGRYRIRKPYSSHTFRLDEIDSVYLFSDGYADQFGGPRDKKFTKKRFKILLEEMQGKPMKEQGEILNETIENWMEDGEQIDDICIMGVGLKDVLMRSLRQAQ